MSAHAHQALAACVVAAAAAAALLTTGCSASPSAAASAAPAASASASPAAAAAAAAAPAVWRPPPPHEGRDAPFVTGSHGHSGYDYGYGATSGTDVNTGVGARRLIYYAHLPDVPATAYPYPRRGRLEPAAGGHRWQHQRPPSYAIVDADTLPEADRPRRREFPPPSLGARYDRLPAPPPPPYYRARPPPDYYSYPERPDLDYSARRPELDYSARRPDLDYSGRRPEVDYAARRPDLDYAARRPELAYAGRPQGEAQAEGRPLPLADPRRPGAPYRGPQAVAPEDPYRGYNPRQPAPWSLQVGARLTVRDDGRRLPLGGGVGGAGAVGGAGRRFYVSSQAPGPHYAVPLRYS